MSFVEATNRSGYAIRVAIIGSAYDLGSVTSLWRQPRTYARFLGAELQFVYAKRLLIVMPNGFGIYWKGHAVDREYALLSKIPIGKGAAGLVDAAQTAISKLAAASGVTVRDDAGDRAAQRRAQPDGDHPRRARRARGRRAREARPTPPALTRATSARRPGRGTARGRARARIRSRRSRMPLRCARCYAR